MTVPTSTFDWIVERCRTATSAMPLTPSAPDWGDLKHHQDHLDALALALHCRIEQGTGIAPIMYVDAGYVAGPTVETQADYLLMLHELGHFAHGHTTAPDGPKFYFSNGVLRSEAQAWEWALDRAIVPLTQATRSVIVDCIKSYERAAMVHGKRPARHPQLPEVEFIFDTPDDFYRSVLSRMRE